jgi:uncharacterized protein (TIGR02453 family)
MSPATPGDFEGFGETTFQFLRGLTANNEKPWFEAHRSQYEAGYVQPALAFVAAIGPRLQLIDSRVQFEPRINGSLFRINRDVRFSSDKTPYKTNLDLWFWYGDRKSWATPGFFLRLTLEQLTLGAGIHQFSPDALKVFRAKVLDEDLGRRLTACTEAITASGDYAIGGETRKTVPRGFDADHERARFLRHEGLHAMQESGLPAEVSRPGFVDYCVERFRAVAPVNAWLVEALGAGGG